MNLILSSCMKFCWNLSFLMLFFFKKIERVAILLYVLFMLARFLVENTECLGLVEAIKGIIFLMRVK